MGVLYDYFRAPDGRAAVRLLAEDDGVPGGPVTAAADVDAIDAKGIDHIVMLGQLVELILDVPPDPEAADDTVMVWPPQENQPASREQYERLPEDSPWVTGPWLEELSDRTRDALADVDDSALPSIAEQWARIEEFDGRMDATSALELVERFVALARRAKRADERLYCWCCV